ncbi:hypothetical protein FQN49_003850 [Arthroderma sp. PD_2]|nr:hypothetical protein FQN49_003850 [Arthroderma sp. PD_2]
MFALPSAKRVCRDDLKSPESSRASSPESSSANYAATALERAFASFETFNPSNATERAASTSKGQPAQDKGENEEEEQEFEFRLFNSVPAPENRSTKEVDGARTKADKHAASSNNQGGVQKLKIRLRSPSPSAGPRGDGGFIVPFRGWDYYFSNPELVLRAVGDSSLQTESRSSKMDERSGTLGETFQDVAVDGNTILARAASVAWPGCHLPWRVVHLPAPNVKPTNKFPAKKPAESLSKRKKPGKKRRIALRKNVTSKQAAEEAEKEKRNRKNRERKIKRRQKERDKKAAARAASGDGPPANATADPDDMAVE